MRSYLALCLCLVLLCTGCAQQELAADIALPETTQEIGDEKLTIHIPPSPVPAGPSPALGKSVPQVSLQTADKPTIAPEPTPLPTASPTPKPSPLPTPDYKLTKVDSERGYMKGHDVNLREGPGTKYTKVGVIGYLTKLVITGKTENWYRIKVGDLTGFVDKNFVGLGDVPSATPKASSTPKPTATPKSTPKQTIKQGEAGNYSDDEIYLVAKLIYAEGKNQSTESFLAMANVLYNRCNSSKFGGSVEKEVYRSGQFTVVKYDSFDDLAPSKAALAAAEDIFNGGTRVLPTNVMFFRAASNGEHWSSSRTFYKKIGGNNYYS